MIHRVSCDQPGFKELRLRPGFNVVLADRTKESTRKQSRNSLGKSTLVEIIHFCLGAQFTRCKSLCSPDLKDWTFYLDFDLLGKLVTVSRNTERHSRIYVNGDTSEWSPQPKLEKGDEVPSYDLQTWNSVLGSMLFGLETSYKKEQYTPSFRSLISYFIRRDKDAFTYPFAHHGNQQPWDQQVHTAFLLGLSWEIAQEFQIIKDKTKAFKDLRKAAKLGYLEALVGVVGRLEADKVRLQKKADRQEAGLKSFKVIDQFRDLEERANALTSEIHSLQNENIRDQHILTRYRKSLEDETTPYESEVQRMYEQIGIELPDIAIRRFADVKEFHRQIIENRRRFLESEIKRLDRELKNRRVEIEARITERGELLAILKTGGALDEYIEFQKEHAKTVAEFKKVSANIEFLKNIERGQSDLKIDRELLLQRARLDLEERSVTREKALDLFARNTEALHKEAGRLILDVGNTGLKLDFDIAGTGGLGVDKTAVFCYDILLSQLWADRLPSPGFLIHDSAIFDSVDERQRASALELAAHESEVRGFQYICTFNSDMLPINEFSESFEIDKYVRLRLTDTSAEGTLTGIRFKLTRDKPSDENSQT